MVQEKCSILPLLVTMMNKISTFSWPSHRMGSLPLDLLLSQDQAISSGSLPSLSLNTSKDQVEGEVVVVAVMSGV